MPFSHMLYPRGEAHCPIAIPCASVGIVMREDGKSKLPIIEQKQKEVQRKSDYVACFRMQKKRWCKS